MRLLPLLVWPIAVLLSTACSAAQRSGIVSLTDLRDNSRPLLIFAPRPDTPQLVIQLRRLNEHAGDLAKRDIVALALPAEGPAPTAAHLTATEASTLRRRFNIAPTDFAVILIGKDGGEKLRSAKPLSFETLRDTIDAMPMRQEEMRRPKQ